MRESRLSTDRTLQGVGCSEFGLDVLNLRLDVLNLGLGGPECTGNLAARELKSPFLHHQSPNPPHTPRDLRTLNSTRGLHLGRSLTQRPVKTTQSHAETGKHNLTQRPENTISRRDRKTQSHEETGGDDNLSL